MHFSWNFLDSGVGNSEVHEDAILISFANYRVLYMYVNYITNCEHLQKILV